MKKLKFLISHPAYLFYYVIMTIAVLAIFKNPEIITDAPLGVQIGIIITILGGTAGMIYHMIDAWEISKTENK